MGEEAKSSLASSAMHVSTDLGLRSASESATSPEACAARCTGKTCDFFLGKLTCGETSELGCDCTGCCLESQRLPWQPSTPAPDREVCEWHWDDVLPSVGWKNHLSCYHSGTDETCFAEDD